MTGQDETTSRTPLVFRRLSEMPDMSPEKAAGFPNTPLEKMEHKSISDLDGSHLWITDRIVGRPDSAHKDRFIIVAAVDGSQQPTKIVGESEAIADELRELKMFPATARIRKTASGFELFDCWPFLRGRASDVKFLD